MHALYTLLLILVISVTTPLWVWRYLTTPKYRGTLRQRLGAIPSTINPPSSFWLHAVSVGEALAAQGLAERLHGAFPDLPLLVSTVTKTGQQVVAQRYPFAAGQFFLPLDLPWIVGPVLDHLRPRFIIIMETELWPNLFRAAGKRKIPIIVANGRLSPDSFRNYRRVRWAMSRFLDPVSIFCMQSNADAERMATIGARPERIRVTGNIKYDQAARLPLPEEMAALNARLGNRPSPVFLAASTHRGEEEIVLDVFTRLRTDHPDLRLILVPRHPERAQEAHNLIDQTAFNLQRLSAMQGDWRADVLLVDEVGWLGRLYGWASVVFVGGSFIDHGGQNLLEPAAWGIAPLFGPSTFNFREASRQILEAEAGWRVEDGAALRHACHTLLSDSDLGKEMGERARKVVLDNAGALSRTLLAIQETLGDLPQPEGQNPASHSVAMGDGGNLL